MTNRGFVELHNPTGFFLVGLGFLLVTLIVAAGGIFAKMVEKEQVERRKQMREAQLAAADVSVAEASGAESPPSPAPKPKPSRRPKADTANSGEATPDDPNS